LSKDTFIAYNREIIMLINKNELEVMKTYQIEIKERGKHL